MASHNSSGDYIWMARNSYGAFDDSSESRVSDQVSQVQPDNVQVQACCRLERLIDPAIEGGIARTQLWSRSAIESPPMEMSRGQDNPMLQRGPSPGDALSVVRFVDEEISEVDMETLANIDGAVSDVRGENGERLWRLYEDDSYIEVISLSSSSSVSSEVPIECIVLTSSSCSSSSLYIEGTVMEIERDFGLQVDSVTDNLPDDFDDVVLD